MYRAPSTGSCIVMCISVAVTTPTVCRPIFREAANPCHLFDRYPGDLASELRSAVQYGNSTRKVSPEVAALSGCGYPRDAVEKGATFAGAEFGQVGDRFARCLLAPRPHLPTLAQVFPIAAVTCLPGQRDATLLAVKNACLTRCSAHCQCARSSSCRTLRAMIASG
jgi:hypothetical protein